jgi:mitogen-activated protein kinase organizer 1
VHRSTYHVYKMNPAPLSPVPHVCVNTLRGHQGPVYSVRFNRNGEYCVTTGSDKTIKLWNPHKGTMINQYKGHGYEVYDVQMYVNW